MRYFIIVPVILLYGCTTGNSTNNGVDVQDAPTPTTVSIKGEQFWMNNAPTYERRTRMETRDNFAYSDTGEWDPERNTDEFVEAMSLWKGGSILTEKNYSSIRLKKSPDIKY